MIAFLNRRPQVTLVLSYLLGQGTYFVALLWLTYAENGPFTAKFSLGILIVSLGIQLGDLGNATVLVRASIEARRGTVLTLLLVRGAVAAVTTASSFWIFNTEASRIFGEDWIYYSFVISLANAFSLTFLHERRGNYAAVGFLTCSQWLVPMLLIFLADGTTALQYCALYIALLHTFSGAVAISTQNKIREECGREIKEQTSTMQYAGTVLVICASAMVGQIWWRIIAASVLVDVGQIEFNALNLARGALVGWMMYTSTWTRAEFTSSLINGEKLITRSGFEYVIKAAHPATISFVLSIISLLLYVSLQIYGFAINLQSSLATFISFLPVGIVWIFCASRTLRAQYLLTAGRYFILELTGLVLAVSSYYLIGSDNHLLAICIADLVKMLTVLVYVEGFAGNRSGSR